MVVVSSEYGTMDSNDSNEGLHKVNGYRTSGTPTVSRDALSPIAIIGLAGRFPGDAMTPKALWEMCCDRRSAWSKIPESRMNSEAYFHPNPSKRGCVSQILT